MVAFFETPRFPETVSNGAQGGPTFKTDVWEGHTGLEQRTAKWSRARHKYNVGLAIRSKTDMDAVREIFSLARGRATGFRFKDWTDYTITNGNIGTGNGSTTVYDIVKKYTHGAYTYTRRILKPVSGTLLVYVNSVLKTETTDYTVDYTTGEITFLAAPTSTHPITVTCEFDVPVRFDTDNIMPEHAGYQSEVNDNIPLVEILFDETDF